MKETATRGAAEAATTKGNTTEGSTTKENKVEFLDNGSDLLRRFGVRGADGSLAAILGAVDTDNVRSVVEPVRATAPDISDRLVEITQSRSDYQIQNFVVNQHDSPERQYYQAVLEASVKYENIQGAILDLEELDLDEAEVQDGLSDVRVPSQIGRLRLKSARNRLRRRSLVLSLVSQVREYKTLVQIIEKFPRYTYEQVQEAEASYWGKRLARQATHDVLAHGRIGVGNLDAMRQAGVREVALPGGQRVCLGGGSLGLLANKESES